MTRRGKLIDTIRLHYSVTWKKISTQKRTVHQAVPQFWCHVRLPFVARIGYH